MSGLTCMVCGVITGKHVILHAPAIVSGFGLWSWLRCCAAVFGRQRTTFLACVCSLLAPVIQAVPGATRGSAMYFTFSPRPCGPT